MAAGISAPSRIPAVLEFDKDELPSRQEAENLQGDYKYETLPDSHCFRIFELLPESVPRSYAVRSALKTSMKKRYLIIALFRIRGWNQNMIISS